MAIPQKRHLIWFGISFIILNILLFLPAYLLNLDESSFLPSSGLQSGGTTGKLFMIFARDNQDLFRLSIDLFLMVLALFALRKVAFYPKGLKVIVSVIFLLLFYYQIYYIGSMKLYGQHPYLYNDFVLASEVLPIFLGQFSLGNNIGYLLGVLGFLLISAFAVFWVGKMHRSIGQINPGKIGWAFMLGTGLILSGFLWKNVRSTYPPTYNTVQWTAPKLAKSLYQPNTDKMKTIPWLSLYQGYMDKKLKQRPNIYVIFVESYGQALYTKNKLHDRYLSLITNVDQQLKEGGWASASTLSLSPILGGRSWLAFGSAFSGIKIENQIHFNDLLDLHSDYPHFIRYLNSQGYETFRMKIMSDKESTTKADYEPSEKFFAFNRWLKHSDIPYQGYKYDHFGGIPDQFALNYFREEIATDSTKPHFLFYITMGSHGPWFPAPPVYEDWRMLDTIQKMPHDIVIPDSVSYRFDALLEANIWDRYFDAITYELEYLTQFILQQGTENDLFVLIGDHQPPMLTGYGMDELYTPMHVISKNPDLVKGFERYGLAPGMVFDPEKTPRVNHEAFYSIMVRELLRQFGEDGVELPAYLPDGLR